VLLTKKVVYKKYITRGGKVYGPYIYHSRRVDGKVVSEYHGTKNSLFSKKVIVTLFLISLVLLTAFLVVNPRESVSKISASAEYPEAITDLVQYSNVFDPLLFVSSSFLDSARNSLLKVVGLITGEGDEEDPVEEVPEEQVIEETVPEEVEEVIEGENETIEEEIIESVNETTEDIDINESIIEDLGNISNSKTLFN